MEEQEYHAQLIIAIGDTITERVKEHLKWKGTNRNSTRRTFFNLNIAWTFVISLIFMLIFLALTLFDLITSSWAWSTSSIIYVVFLIIGFIAWITIIFQYIMLRRNTDRMIDIWNEMRDCCKNLKPVFNYKLFYSKFVKRMMRREYWYDSVSESSIKLGDEVVFATMVDSYNDSLKELKK